MGRKTKQNHLTSPELLEQVNPENLRLLDDFLDLDVIGKPVTQAA